MRKNEYIHAILLIDMKKFIEILLPLLALISVAPYMTSCSNDKKDDGVEITDGYVRHIILWTLSEDLSQEEKLEVIRMAESAAEKLDEDIDGLVKAEVIYEKRLDSSNCDFMFDMYFKSSEALEEFSVNPEHLAVVARLKPYITGRACLDIEL